MQSTSIVCFANSRKNTGRCIAGKTTSSPHRWLRPIGHKGGTRLLAEEILCSPAPKPLDIISIPLNKHVPQGCQTENWRTHKAERWVHRWRITWDKNIKHTHRPNVMFHGTEYCGRVPNDRIPAEIADPLNGILRLVQMTVSPKRQRTAYAHIAAFDLQIAAVIVLLRCKGATPIVGGDE